MTVLLWNTGERTYSGLWSSPRILLTRNPPHSLLPRSVLFVWAGTLHSFPPFFNLCSLSVTDKGSAKTESRRKSDPSCELLPPWSTRFLWVLGRPGCYAYWTCLCVCGGLSWLCGVIWETELFRFNRFRVLAVKTLNRTVRKRIYKLE